MISRLVFKVIVIITGIIVIYAAAILLLFMPEIEKNTIRLEEHIGISELSKISLLVDNAAREMEDYKKTSLEVHKKELISLTEVAFNLIRRLHDASLPENLKKDLRVRTQDFKAILEKRYASTLIKQGEQAAKTDILKYIDDYRYDNGIGYFFAAKQDTTIVMHPVNHDFIGKNCFDLKDQNGVYFVKDLVKRVLDGNGEGYIQYVWNNPLTNQPEDKLTYGFLFKPTGWIISTGFYLPNIVRQQQKKAIDYVRSLSYGDNDYFFISDYNNVLISHPYLQDINFSNIKDVYGNFIIPPMVQVAKEQGGGFVSYWWKKNKDDETVYEKLSYARHFPEWQWVTGTGIYLDNIQQEIAQRKQQLVRQLRQTLQEKKVGENGYFYILDAKANVVFYPDALEGKNLTDFSNPDYTMQIFAGLIDAYKNGSGVFYYKWNRPDDKGNYIYDKVAWVDYNAYFGWYICASAYVSELKKTSSNLRRFILISTLLVLFAVIIFATFFFHRLLQPIFELSEKAKLVKHGNFSIRNTIKRRDEIGMLAETFNDMLDTIEENIRTLDFNVREKTHDLEEQKEVFETLFYKTTDGVVLIENNRFIDCNDACVRLLEYDNKSQVLSLHPADISPKLQPDGRDSYEKACEMMHICLTEGSHHFEWVHKTAHAVEFWAEVVLTKIVIQGKTVIHANTRNITDRKNLERGLKEKTSELETSLRDLRATQSKLIQSEKMASLGGLVAGVAHEINTPVGMALTGITHIDQETKHIRQKYNDDEMTEEDFYSFLEDSDDLNRSIIINLNKAAELIKSFKQVAVDQSSEELRTFKLKEYVDEILISLHNRIKKTKLLINIDIDEQLELTTVPGAISQILTNFVMNSIVHGYDLHQTGTITIHVYLADHTLNLIYKDDGKGMDANTKARMFDPFFTTKRHLGGSGLGMNIVYNLVTQTLKGSIECESQLGKGVEFKVLLPISDHLGIV
ncbi:cache domain-containing protein [Rhodoferax sp. 4810]|uniref:histidine kinase n=1 Tax=Thiospirillum jenense TaxID=1653858 RepID=A0A839H890_9GAMM|nr:cache domain-containing protein [Thiospirillum jenense]MBB1074190.1 cache domain-containing protein [Rhodoferax jenense]MBB1125264.1 cache domain-containing protein [Thiospirillum jenense]